MNQQYPPGYGPQGQYQQPQYQQPQDPNGMPLNRPITASDIPMALKARYFGSGLVVGVFVSPLVRKGLAIVQPKLDTLMDSLTGKAEGLVEKSSDLVAKAKEALRKMEATNVVDDHAGHDHAPGEHTAPAKKPKASAPKEGNA